MYDAHHTSTKDTYVGAHEEAFIYYYLMTICIGSFNYYKRGGCSHVHSRDDGYVYGLCTRTNCRRILCSVAARARFLIAPIRYLIC